MSEYLIAVAAVSVNRYPAMDPSDSYSRDGNACELATMSGSRRVVHNANNCDARQEPGEPHEEFPHYLPF